MNDTCILIPSCDSFEDVWQPALDCIAKNWPDCPYPVWTIAQKKTFGDNCVQVGEDLGWSRNLLYALERINCEFVLMFLDDMLVGAVDQESVSRAEQWLRDNTSAGAIQVGPSNVTYTHDRSNEWLATVKNSSDYRVATGPTIWRKEYLKAIACHTDSPWDFEIKGTQIARQMEPTVHLSIDRPIKVHYTAITRGKVERGAKRFLDSQGIDHNFQREETGA